MVSDVHVPTELPAPSHLVRELRRRPLLRLRPPVGAGSPWIAGIDVVFNLQPPRRHRRIRRRRSTPGLLELAYDIAVRSSPDSRSSLARSMPVAIVPHRTPVAVVPHRILLRPPPLLRYCCYCRVCPFAATTCAPLHALAPRPHAHGRAPRWRCPQPRSPAARCCVAAVTTSSAAAVGATVACCPLLPAADPVPACHAQLRPAFLPSSLRRCAYHRLVVMVVS